MRNYARASANCATSWKNSPAEKGFLHFGKEERAVLEQDASGREIACVQQDLCEIVAELRAVSMQISGILQKCDSAGEFHFKEKVPDVDVGKKKKTHDKPLSLEERNLQTIDGYLAAYSAENAAREAVIGIRPEDIHLYNAFSGNKSEPVRVRASFVELLGSEYCVYIDLPVGKLIMKTGLDRVIRTGDEIEICFNMDKLRVFDKINGMRVL